MQPVVDEYVDRMIPESQFLAGTRPWPRYESDYRPIVEFAKAHRFPVIASDVPRHIASDVAKNGPSVIDALGTDRGLAARDLQCPTSGDYYNRFMEVMSGHPPSGDPSGPGAAATNNRFFLAQCLKDETMGESIANAFDKSAGRATVVHINGAFHSDYREGTADSAGRRMPGRRIAVVSVVPVEDLDTVKPDEDDMKLGDYVLFTVKQAD